METASLPDRPRRRLGPWAMFFLVFGLLVVLLVALVIVSAATITYRASARVEGELARIRQAGEPTSGEELDEHYRLPPGVEDTTALWLEATDPLESEAFGADAAALPIVGDSEAVIPPVGQPWPDLEAAEKLLDDYRRSVELLHQAAELGGAARYPADFRQGILVLLEHLQPLRQGARLLSLEAWVRAHRGDPHGAAESIHAILMMARSLEREPVLVSMLVRISCDGIAREQLQSLLASVDFSDEDLAKLQEDLRAADYHEHLREAMLGERVTGMMAIENPGSWEEGSERGLFGTAWRLTQSDGAAFFLDHMGAMIAAAEKPWPEALEEAARAQDRLDALGRGPFLTKIRHVIPLLLAPALGVAFEAAARHVAMTGAADAAVACERYRRRYGKLPEQLDQLVPEFLAKVPVDPYTGEPLQYVVRDDEYLVYSVGSNRIDEGGLIAEGLDGDYVFRVGPPLEREEEGMADVPD
ncbi:MAG TPA: hypothetical protein VMY37_32825 [Thermoguttaceae bacterium]|nr:hypothetical protein [Thermoguttaceae bacterium]